MNDSISLNDKSIIKALHRGTGKHTVIKTEDRVCSRCM